MAGTTQYFGISYPTATDYVKDGASNMQTIATGFDSAVAIPTYNNQTGTSYTFVLADAAKTVTSNNAGAVTFTIPPQSSVAWAAGTTLTVRNYGAGAVTFAGGSGVTVTNTASTVAQYGSAKIVRTGSDAWTVLPDSGGASGALTLVKSQTIGTAVSSVTVSDVFSATYDNYRIFISGGAGSTSSDLNLQLGASTTGYYAGASRVNYGAGTASLSSNNNSSSFTLAGRGAITGLNLLADLSAPFLAKNTILYGFYVNQDTAGAAGSYAGYHNVATSYTGFTITPSAGTLTGGEIQVYGYQK